MLVGGQCCLKEASSIQLKDKVVLLERQDELVSYNTKAGGRGGVVYKTYYCSIDY